MALVSQGEEKDVEVRSEDRDMITEFGRLNAQLHELRDDVKILKERVDNLSDASEEIMLAGGGEGSIKMLVGEVFVGTTEEEATAAVDAQLAEKQAQLQEMEREIKGIEDRQAELKSVLYARFGGMINLEE